MVEPGSEDDVTAEGKPHEVVTASVTSPENTSETIEESAATPKSSTSRGGLRFAVSSPLITYLCIGQDRSLATSTHCLRPIPIRFRSSISQVVLERMTRRVPIASLAHT